MIELGVRRTKTHLKRLHCYDKMVQAVIAQKSSKVDTDHQKISMRILTMFKVAKKEEKKTDKWLNQDFSQDDNNVEKKKKQQQELLLERDTAQQK